MNGKITGIILASVLTAAALPANAAPADHFTAGMMLNDVAKLKAQTAATGSPIETLKSYSGHTAMLAFRDKDGNGEIHHQYTDVFYVVKGKATLLTEGTLSEGKEISPGEWRGKAVTGGKTTVLNTGDIVNIPVGTPHQLLIAPGDTFLYFIVKVKEAE
jgi:mannose-6-phosphate isomerase-like protein (cupin superfamily)